MTRSKLTAATCLVLIGAGLSGCLERTIKITTEPEGALVWLNDVEVGRTPLETDFTFYGIYDVQIRREGYEPVITKAKADTPIQELPGIDLVAEAVPYRFRNVVHWHWVLAPVAERTGDKAQVEAALIERAKEQRSLTVPTPTPTPAPTPEGTPTPAPEPASADSPK